MSRIRSTALVSVLSFLLLLSLVPPAQALVTVDADVPVQLVDGYAAVYFDSGLSIWDTLLIGGNWSKFDAVNVTVQKTPAAAPNVPVHITSWTPNVTSEGSNLLTFAATATTGDVVYFSFVGLTADAAVDILVDSVVFESKNTGASGSIAFSYVSWSTHTFSIVIQSIGGGTGEGGGGGGGGLPPPPPTTTCPPYCPIPERPFFFFPFQWPAFNVPILLVGIIIVVVGGILTTRGPRPYGPPAGLSLMVVGFVLVAAPIAGWNLSF